MDFVKSYQNACFTKYLYVSATALLKWQVKMTDIIFKGLRPESAPLRESDLLETTCFSL